MTVLLDQDARTRIRTDLDTTLVVEAAAGTGKTTELVCRMVAAIETRRASLDRMVAVTFTEPAAGELKLRLRGAIEAARQRAGDDGRRNLTAALPQLEEARIGTIHSFCVDLLRERPVEAGVDPLFEVAPDDVARPLFERAFDRWFEKQLEKPAPAVARILRRRSREDGPRARLRAAAWQLVERRDFPAPWRRAPGFARDTAIDDLLARMRDLAEWAPRGDPDDWFTKSLGELAGFVSELARAESLRPRDYDGVEAALVEFQKRWHSAWTGFRKSRDDFPKAELRERRDVLAADLRAFADAAGADLAPALREELRPVVDAYEAAKERAGCLDFLDLLVRARDLVRKNADVRRDLQQRFTHILVDEFQDTDPLQAEILLLLAADDPAETDWQRVRPVAGKLFTVGDPKQSIYRFRRADVALYEAVKRQLLDAGGALVELVTSFRAVPDIQEAVNAAFAPRFDGSGAGQARYVPLRPFRTAVPSQPAVVALPVPAPYGDYRKIVHWRIEKGLPDVVAAFVEWLVKSSGWTVTERERPEERVAIRARHVCLLFRRFRSFFTDVTHPYVRALEGRHLPHLLVGGSSFHRREEVEALRNALGAIERPDDELALFATLRGPLFALDDGALLAFRVRFGSLHPFRAVPDDLAGGLREVADALAVLRELHRGRNRRPIADTIGRLLGATRAHAGLAIWPTGEQALANVSRLVDLARRAERNGTISFRSFVERLAEDAERGEASDAPIVEEGTGGVRIMTVHRAKGLEFPVVILADLTANETPSTPSRWVDAGRALCAMRLAGCAPPELQEHEPDELAAERDEAARVLYVAATRARDLLVVPVVGDGAQDGWIGALDPVVRPGTARAGRPETRTPAGCPTNFGTDSVPGRPADVPRPAGSVAPGLHRPEAGAHHVVWWDPATLRLDVDEAGGVAQQKLLAADESGMRSTAGIERHDAWQKARARVRADGGAPSVRVVTATERAFAGDGDVPDVPVETAGAAAGRPHGKRFGALVHAVLAAVPLDAGAPEVRRVAVLESRLLGATAEETDAATATVVRALAHPLLRRAAAAPALRRETPVVARQDDGSLVEGVVDAAFLDDDGWVVIDFKTDVEIAGRLDEYRRQVALYAGAIARATGRPARAVLLQV